METMSTTLMKQDIARLFYEVHFREEINYNKQ